jgi:hypothetical protein
VVGRESETGRDAHGIQTPPPKMLASIGMPTDIPSMIAFLKQAGALARDWAPPEGIVFLALWAWLMILMLMFWKFMK